MAILCRLPFGLKRNQHDLHLHLRMSDCWKSHEEHQPSSALGSRRSFTVLSTRQIPPQSLFLRRQASAMGVMNSGAMLSPDQTPPESMFSGETYSSNSDQSDIESPPARRKSVMPQQVGDSTRKNLFPKMSRSEV